MAEKKDIFKNMKRKKGKVYTVGIGNSKKHITLQAKEILAAIDVVAGHYGFIEMAKEYINSRAKVIDDREARNRSTTFESYQQNRVSAVVTEALKGQAVAVLSGGDSGIWGMAGVFLEAQMIHHNEFDLEIVPGIPSLTTIAAKLGAPLQNGFSVISIGDEDTPFEIIEQRLKGAALGGGVIVLYKLILENLAYPHFYPKEKYPQLYPPKEKTMFRLRRTFKILHEHIPLDRPMAIVTDVHDQTSSYSSTTLLLGGEGGKESITLTTFKEFLEKSSEYRFFTTIIIGDASTQVYNDRMVTPQWNYKWKYAANMLKDIEMLPYLKEQATFFSR
jgi:precorrin-3B C17-methyltransferase